MKVVFDTNIFVSAFVFPGGQADKALEAVIHGQCRLALSKPLVHEVLGVLASRFARDPEALARTALFLASLGDMVRPRKRIHVLDDEPDNRILECALTSRADCIVTGDKAMLALKEYDGVRILTRRAFLESVQVSGIP